MADEISEYDDIIDSRDVIARIAELADEAPFTEPGDDRGEELATLRELAEQGQDYCEDWTFGETLVRDSYFRDFAEEFASDVGYTDSANEAHTRWPFTHIDWEAAARDLRQDYSELTFRGVSYWAR